MSFLSCHEKHISFKQIPKIVSEKSCDKNPKTSALFCMNLFREIGVRNLLLVRRERDVDLNEGLDKLCHQALADTVEKLLGAGWFLKMKFNLFLLGNLG